MTDHFSVDTCKRVLGDSLVRIIEAHARASIETGAVYSPLHPSDTYWDQSKRAMEAIVWQAAYDKRRARLERMASNANAD